jgi:heme-degrading monooxygenase HmoA
VISRHWKGVAKHGLADAYIEHLRTDTFPALARITGFVRASILRRPVDAGTEFQIVTVWDSLSAIHAFAGEDIDAAVVPPGVQAMMATYDPHIVHYEITGTFAP